MKQLQVSKEPSEKLRDIFKHSLEGENTYKTYYINFSISKI